MRGVSTDQGEIAAPVVVAATGPWTRPLFQKVGLDLPIETEYHQVAILKNRARHEGRRLRLHRLSQRDLLPFRRSRQISDRRFLRPARRRPRQFSAARLRRRTGRNHRARQPPGAEAGERGSHARSHRRLRHDSGFTSAAGRNFRESADCTFAPAFPAWVSKFLRQSAW